MSDLNYRMPEFLYKQVLWVIKDYSRLMAVILQERAENTEGLYPCQAPSDTGIRSGAIARPTERTALQKAERDAQYDLVVQDADHKVKAIDAALATVPKAYAGAIIQNIVFNVRLKDLQVEKGSERTIKRYKQQFLFWAAVNLNWWSLLQAMAYEDELEGH